MFLFIINARRRRIRYLTGIAARILRARLPRRRLLQESFERHAREDPREFIEQMRRKAHLPNRLSGRGISP